MAKMTAMIAANAPPIAPPSMPVKLPEKSAPKTELAKIPSAASNPKTPNAMCNQPRILICDDMRPPYG